MSLRLEVFEDTACFRYPPEHEACVQEFDRLLDQHEAGRAGERSYLDALQDIAERYPWFIDAHAHIGNALLKKGRTRRALDAYREGVAQCETAISAGYTGLVEWSHLDNRPFFRAAHGAVLCHLHLRQWSKAIDLMNAMLAWNPRDNQGMRHLLGSALLRAGRLDEARAPLIEFQGGDPSMNYELALLRLLEGDYRTASTSLRQGFVENRYIAEMICGMPDPLPIAMWHGSSLAKPDFARDYIRLFGTLWNKTHGAVAFVRWLSTHPEVMAERATILACDAELLWEHDFERRRSIGDRRDALALAVDQRLSDRIIAQRSDRNGNTVWPWLHAASCR